ncbi:Alpha/Beta hydrolase protein [Mycena galericulata]|nr:Alpha/Beta hydrolase protein [Mycena galericulata]
MPQLQLLSGHDWAFVDANKDGRTTLLCLHGFPDLSYGYRHQIGPWARAGFRVVVPDMLGYGGSDAPVDPAQYTTKRLAADLAALLTALGVKQAVVIGHDWGSFIAGRFALWHPDRVLGLVLMSLPYSPPGRNLLSLEHAVERAPNLGYQLYLASPAAAPTIEANLPYFIATTFAPPYAPVDFTPRGAIAALLATAPPPAAVAELPSMLTKAERALYCAAFRARGMTGPTNYYRTTRLRATEEAETAAAASTSPPGPSDDQLAHAIELTREAVQLDYQPAVKAYEGRSAALLGEVVRGEPHPPPRSAMRADRLQGIVSCPAPSAFIFALTHPT